MIIKARCNDLNKVKTSVNENADLLDTEINKMLDSIATLQNNWEGGNPSTIFYNNVNTYLNNMKTISSIYREFGQIINFMNTNYFDLDTTYSEELQGGVVEHE